MKIVLTFIWLFFTVQSLSGQQTIRGVIYDAVTKSKLSSVNISPVFYGDSTFSAGDGRFKILVPKNYRKAITYSHPDYYPYKKLIKKGSKMHLHMIHLIPKSIPLDTLYYLDDPKNKVLRLDILESRNKIPIPDASVWLESSYIIAYSNSDGRVKTVVPGRTQSLLVKHDQFFSENITLKNKAYKNGMKVTLDRKIFREADTSWKSKKNILSWAPGELTNGAVGLRYERQIKFRQSIGIHASWYLFGFAHPILSYSDYSRFKGFKLGLFYRFYFSRNKYRGIFVEAKPLVGYFNFYELAINYENSNYVNFVTEDQFWTAGIAVSIGFIILPNGGPLALNLSIGYQYFPTHFEDIRDEDGNLHIYNDDWWYWGGPGSYVDIKFTLGGIF